MFTWICLLICPSVYVSCHCLSRFSTRDGLCYRAIVAPQIHHWCPSFRSQNAQFSGEFGSDPRTDSGLFCLRVIVIYLFWTCFGSDYESQNGTDDAFLDPWQKSCQIVVVRSLLGRVNRTCIIIFVRSTQLYCISGEKHIKKITNIII